MNEWYFCFECGAPSVVCSDCDASICAGGCKHATELFKFGTWFWNEDDISNIGVNGDMGFGSITEEGANKMIKEFNDCGRKRYKGCLGVFGKEEI